MNLSACRASRPNIFLPRFAPLATLVAVLLLLASPRLHAQSGPVYQINCGASEPPAGVPVNTGFQYDAYASGGDKADTTQAIDTSGVANAAPESVYKTERYGTSFSYTFPNLQQTGQYTVRLHFAEYRYGAKGYNGKPARLFNVSINGDAVLSNFNVYAEAGAKYRAVVRDFPATPDNNEIAISFASGTDNAEIKGIEILGPAVEVDINKTIGIADDLVRLHSDTPKREFTTPCTIKALGKPSNDLNVTLSSPGGGGTLGFTTDATGNGEASSLALTLPKSGTAKTFYITGEAKSTAIGDATIQAADASSNATYAKTPATIFWFKDPNSNNIGGKMAITADGAYQKYSMTDSSGYTYTGIIATPDAITATAQTALMPSGVSTTAPQVVALKLGIEQNAMAGTNVYTFGKPNIKWYTHYNNDTNLPLIADGTMTVPTSSVATQTDQFPTVTCNDAGSSTDEPFYLRTPYKSTTGLVDITKPSTVTDNPFAIAPDPYGPFPIKAANGYAVAEITYHLQKASISVPFMDWATVADTDMAKAGQTQWLSEGMWKLDVTQDIENSITGQKAAVQKQSLVPPPDTPVETGPICNTLVKQGKFVGSANVTWTYPNTTPNK